MKHFEINDLHFEGLRHSKAIRAVIHAVQLTASEQLANQRDAMLRSADYDFERQRLDWEYSLASRYNELSKRNSILSATLRGYAAGGDTDKQTECRLELEDITAQIEQLHRSHRDEMKRLYTEQEQRHKEARAAYSTGMQSLFDALNKCRERLFNEAREQAQLTRQTIVEAINTASAAEKGGEA